MADKITEKTKPRTDNVADVTQSWKKSLGTEQERQARWQQEVLNRLGEANRLKKEEIRQMAQMNGSLGGFGDAIVGTALCKFGVEKGRSVRNYGGR